MKHICKAKWLAALIAIALTANLWGCAGKQETTAPEEAASKTAEETAPEAAETTAPEAAEETENLRAEQILSEMTLEEKIAQMIIPAIRTWNGENVTDLSAVPELAKALRAHPYGGVILFGSNVADTY